MVCLRLQWFFSETKKALLLSVLLKYPSDVIVFPVYRVIESLDESSGE